MISKLINAYKRSRVAKNAGWIIAGKVAQMALSLVVGVLSARYLGPSNYGLIGYANAYTTFFASLCNLGINAVMVKELVSNPDKEGEIIGTTLYLRAISSFLSALAVMGITFLVDANEPLTIAIVTISAFGMVLHICEAFNYWFQSKLKSKMSAIAAFIGHSVTSVYKLFLLISGKPVVYFALATSVDYIAYGAILIIMYRKQKGPRLSVSLSYGKKLLQKSYHFILPGIMAAIYGQTDKFMLKHMVGSAESGYYSAASYLCFLWCFVLTAIIDSLAPSIMQAYETNKEDFKRKNRILYCIVFYLSTFVSLMFTFFGRFALLILYGKKYLPAVPAMMIITWYTGFTYLGTARNPWVVCENKQKYLKYIYASAAVANIVLNLVLIPIWGAVGAAVASFAAEFVTTMVVPLFIKDLRENTVMMLEAITFKGLRRR